jgi:hypothetical protein
MPFGLSQSGEIDANDHLTATIPRAIPNQMINKGDQNEAAA